MPTKPRTILAAPAGSGLSSQSMRTMLTQPEINRIFRYQAEGRPVKSMASLMHRSESAIRACLLKQGSSREFAEARSEADLHLVQERAFTECNVAEAMEILHRHGVKGFVKVEKNTGPQTQIAIVQAVAPSQEVIDAEEARVIAVREGTLKEPEKATIAIPGLVHVEAP